MLRIINGELYDPANQINGQIRDLCVDRGQIVAQLPPDSPVIDATGLIVMPGGVDIHAHIAGPKVNVGRKLRPEDHRNAVMPRTSVTRSGVGYSVPSTFATGYQYARMGYTTVMEAAAPPLLARHVHEELSDIPIIDKGVFVIMGNNYFVLKYIAAGDFARLKDYVAWLLSVTGGYVIKLINPGGVDQWKWGRNVRHLDDPAATFPVTPRQIITSLARVQQELGIPHPIHVHCNNLGTPGNARTTLETMQAVEGWPVHITHIQFNGYGGDDWPTLRSGAPELVEYINEHPHITVDLGQVAFGPTTTMTADGPWEYQLGKLAGSHHRWVNLDLELEGGAGILPYTFSERNRVNAVQWATGLEFALSLTDPWRVFLTTDHPNAGPFLSYPEIIKLLMQRDYRAERLERVHPWARERSNLSRLDREYSLYDIAIITRAGPAKSLGLRHKGHLGVGADADIAIYPKLSDPKEMFSQAKYVIKGGEVIIRDSQFERDQTGQIFHVLPDYDPDIEMAIREDFEQYYTISFANYPVNLDHYLPQRQLIGCVKL